MKDSKDLVTIDIPGFPSLVLPSDIPPTDYEPGIFPLFDNWLKKKKLNQIYQIKALEQEISECNLKAFKAQMEMFLIRMLAPQKMKTEHESMKSQTEYEREIVNMQKIANMKAHEELKQLQLDSRKMELEYQQMLKEIGNGTGDD